MLNILRTRLANGERTIAFPDGAAPPRPNRYRGLPVLDGSQCQDGCDECVQACPTDAMRSTNGQLTLDLGRCLFCTECVDHCSTGAVRFTNDYRMAVRERDDLLLAGRALELAEAFDARCQRLFGRSLKLRQVSAGGCNACEADINVLNTVVFDLSRFGIQFVASPRQADGIVVTGPITANMRLALQKVDAAMPSPKFVIAVGACAISGGPYIGHEHSGDGADSVLPVDLYIPGCPPHPLTILDGILRLMGRIDERTGQSSV